MWMSVLQAPRFDSGGLFSQDPALSYIRSLPNLNNDQQRSLHKVIFFCSFIFTPPVVWALMSSCPLCKLMCSFQILGAKDYALILGMPGTGKTYTMVHAVKSLLIRGESILLTSYTNSAIDTLLMKLKTEVCDTLSVVCTFAFISIQSIVFQCVTFACYLEHSIVTNYNLNALYSD